MDRRDDLLTTACVWLSDHPRLTCFLLLVAIPIATAAIERPM